MSGTVNQDNTSITFGPFTYTLPGTYTYTVTETGEIAGVTNDEEATTGKTVTVTVVDNHDGTLTAEADFTSDSPVTFTNTYNVDPTTATFPVKKIMEVPEGLEGPEEWSYTIDVTANDGAPEAETMTGTITNTADTVTFGPFTYNVPGTYTYTVTESGEFDGVTNDEEATTGKTVTVDVVDNHDGTLTATADFTADSPVTFTNSYDAIGNIVFEATKTVTGRELAENEFTFELYENGSLLQSKQNGDDGKITFDQIGFTRLDVGSHTYIIKEVVGSTIGIVYDTTEYTVTVEVSDHRDGTLANEINISSAAGTSETVVFENPYETTEVNGEKTWNDDDDRDGIRPESITVNLLQDGEVYDTATVTENENHEWKYGWTDLPKYKPGATTDEKEEHVYTVEEVEITYDTEAVSEGYTVDYSGTDIINTHNPELIDIPVQKFWDDAEDQDGLRPDSITIRLYATYTDEEIAHATLTADEYGDWSYTFEGLFKYRNHGEIIEYYVEEDEIEFDEDKYAYGYDDAVIEGSNDDGFEISNPRTPEVRDIEVSKVWDDADDQDGIRPESIVIRLFATYTEEEIANAEIIPDENGNWSYTFTDLPKFRNHGELIEYYIEEDEIPAVEGHPEAYSTEIEGDMDTGFTVTNSHTPEEIEVSVEKKWIDNDNQDGIRPTSIRVDLYGDTERITGVVLSEANGWKATVTGLPKYRDQGVLIEYTWTERSISGYSLTSTKTVEYSTTLTNLHTPELTSVSVKKIWDDNNDNDGIRPVSVKVQLYANGQALGEAVRLNDANDWSYIWTNLPVNANGRHITYTVAEVATPLWYFYSTNVIEASEYNFIVVNKHDPITTEVTVVKVWDDVNDQDRIRPESINVTLSNGITDIMTVTLNAENGWKATVTDLPKYINGKKVEYTWKEGNIEGYSLVSTSVEGTVTTLTNKHVPETTVINGTKTWIDDDNHDGLRPETIIIRLYANEDLLIMTKVVSAKDGWKYSFTDLPKYMDGKEIEYKVVEDVIEGYTAEYNGYDIINRHELERITVSVKKNWIDNKNQDGKRPDSITITLYANGIKVESVVVKESDNWEYLFTDLLKYDENGERIEYTVTEDEVPDYYTIIAGDMETGIVITNKYTAPEIPLDPPETKDDENPASKTAEIAVGTSVATILAIAAFMLINKRKTNV